MVAFLLARAETGSDRQDLITSWILQHNVMSDFSSVNAFRNHE